MNNEGWSVWWMWFALVVLFFGGLWAAPAALLRKERENNNTKQTSFNQRKQFNNEWRERSEESNWLNWLKEMKEMKSMRHERRERNEKPSESAVSEINQFFFCWPAVRHQKEELNDWRVLAGGRAWVRSQPKQTLNLIHWRWNESNGVCWLSC